MISTLPNLEAVRAASAIEVASMLRQMEGSSQEMLASSVLAMPGASDIEIGDVEKRIGHRLAPVFRRVISMYELGGLEWCGVVFGGAPSFIKFLGTQLASGFAGTGPSVERCPVLASSAGYEIRIQTDADEILARPIDGEVQSSAIVASDIDLLLRALGSLSLMTQVDDELEAAMDVARLVGAPTSHAFWLDRIRGFA